MASVTRTLEQKVPARTALFISIAVILVRWITKTITNIYYTDVVLDRISSFQGLVLSALTNGIFVVATVTLLLYLSRETYRDLGFRGGRLLRQLGLGCAFGVLIFVLDTFVTGPAVSALLSEATSQGIDLRPFFARKSYLPVWLMIALLKGGFTEELWRIFGLTRFEKLYSTAGLVFALIGSSLVFGLGHFYQGPEGAITNAIEGLFFALVYLRKRSAWEAVSAHAMFDLIAVTLGFVIYA